ncbi:hypothetical protein GQ55_7G214500 [Panicum hallii var. hallii]|uniref:Uncharacterized protein n=1 Tax=Panicum hallii var. hallii TaxID=1504633 RepID=A0A2T7CXK2_9POAL|nr:hypothetical protein GQ55_7G214500 [Panicum hallii var. hallii]
MPCRLAKEASTDLTSCIEAKRLTAHHTHAPAPLPAPSPPENSEHKGASPSLPSPSSSKEKHRLPSTLPVLGAWRRRRNRERRGTSYGGG